MILQMQLADIYRDLIAVSAGKPVITYDEKFKSAQKLKAGSTLTIAVNVTGTPTPKVSWLQAGEPVSAASVDTKDGYSTLTAKNVTAKLSGQIQVKAENKVGTDSAEFTIEIKGSTIAVSLISVFCQLRHLALNPHRETSWSKITRRIV